MTVRARQRALPIPAWSCVLAGGLLLLAAVAAYAVEVYSESATYCGGLVSRDPSVDATCDDLYARRETLVVGLTIVGAALLALAPFCTRRPADDAGPSLDFSWGSYAGAAAAASLFLPFCYLPFFFAGYVFADARLSATSTGLPAGWKTVAVAAGVVTACLVLRSVGLTERSALTAAGLAVPLVLATLVAVARPVADFTIDSSAQLPAASWWLLGSPVLFLVLVLVARLQQGDWPGPPRRVGVVLALAATAVVTVVLMPQLLPTYRGADGGGPYPRNGLDVEVWAPVLVVMCLASVLVVGAASRSSGRPPS